MTEENQDNPEVEYSQKVMNQRHANHPTLTKLWSSVIIRHMCKVQGGDDSGLFNVPIR